MMSYKQAIEYIHSISWSGSRPGLERITALCSMMGDPQKDLSFIHVAGTNGKGSSCSMLSSVLCAAGYNVGLFTSPYVKFFNERMCIRNQPISDSELAHIIEYVKPLADSMEDRPTEFELITAVAFEFFKRHECDVVILEVGMGGRLDSTNVISNPLVSVITGIALDHTAYLGTSVSEIAAEKAGIIKENCPVVFGGEDDCALSVIKEIADSKGSALSTVDMSSLEITNTDLFGTTFNYKDKKDLKISLLGSYQPSNAATVLEVISVLKMQGLDISDAALREGLERAKWSARFELLSASPVIIYDGGHNIQGITACRDSIKQYFDGKVNIVMGVMADKDYPDMIKIIAPLVKTAFAVMPQAQRSLSSENLALALEAQGVKAESCGPVKNGLKRALERAKADGIPTVALGSLYMYKEFTDALTELLSD